VRTNKFLITGSLLTLGNIVSGLLGFARNIILARLISLEDFGIAATFAVALQIVEMSSNFSVGRFLIQSKLGNQVDIQKSAHCLQIIRGLVCATVLYFGSGVFAAMFRIPELTWAFQLLSLVHVLLAFSHSDITRIQREMRFAAKVIQDIIPQSISLIISIPLALYLKDYRVSLYVIIIQVFISFLISHILAERPYRAAWNKQHILTIMSFGWPLFLNGFIMIGVLQAEKLIVGSSFDMMTLGWFSASLTLAFMPSMLATKILQTFFLPILSRYQSRKASFQYSSTTILIVLMAIGTVAALGFSIAGPSLLIMTYGENYSFGMDIIIILGIMFGFRIAREGANIVALAKGLTKLPMYFNLVRTLWIPIAAISAFTLESIELMAYCGVLAEFSSISVAFWLLHQKKIINMRPIRTPAITLMSFTIIGGIIAKSHVGYFPHYLSILLSVFAAGLVCTITIYTNPIILRVLRQQNTHFSK